MLVVGARVTERDAVPGGAQRAHQIDAAVELGREGDDADVGTARGDRLEDLAAGERGFPAIVGAVRLSASAGTRRHSTGCAPAYSGLRKLLSRCAGSTRADAAPGASRARATCCRKPRSASGSQATVVGQNAVTP